MTKQKNIMNNKRKPMTELTCTYCYRKYRKKENYEKHLSCCEFFYRSRMVHADIIYEPLPSQRELYQLVKELAYKCDKLEQKIEKMETANRNIHRKQITDYLKEYTPHTSVNQWLNQIEIQEKHLITVFENTIIEGLKQVIQDHIFNNFTLPFCSFQNKNNTIYIYNNDDDHNEAKWYIATNKELDKIISTISYKFLQAFVDWKQTNLLSTNYYDEEEGDSSTIEQEIAEQIAEDLKKKQLMYMMKINGNRVHGNYNFSRIGEDVKRNEIKTLLSDLTQRKLPTFVEG